MSQIVEFFFLSFAKYINPFLPTVPTVPLWVTFSQNFYFNLRRDHKKVPMSVMSRYRRKEPISGYIPIKEEEEKNSVSKGLRHIVYKHQ